MLYIWQTAHFSNNDIIKKSYHFLLHVRLLRATLYTASIVSPGRMLIAGHGARSRDQPAGSTGALPADRGEVRRLDVHHLCECPRDLQRDNQVSPTLSLGRMTLTVCPGIVTSCHHSIDCLVRIILTVSPDIVTIFIHHSVDSLGRIPLGLKCLIFSC